MLEPKKSAAERLKIKKKKLKRSMRKCLSKKNKKKGGKKRNHVKDVDKLRYLDIF